MSGFTLMPWAPSQWTDSSGNILEFGIIRFYESGTLIPKSTFKKADGSEANENPLVLDSAARARVWLINGEAYDIVVHNKDDEYEYSILDVVANSGVTGGTTSLFQDSPTVTWSTMTVGENVYNIATVIPDGILDGKVKSLGTQGDDPGFLAEKLVNGNGSTFNVDNIKRVIIPLSEYLKKTGGVVTEPTEFQDLTVLELKMGEGLAGILAINTDGIVTRISIPEESGKIKADSSDISGYFVEKIRPGTGIEITQTTDGVNGVVLHISKTDDGALTAPLHEVITGDGAGGVLSDPGFTAVGGDVFTETVTASATGPAITAPNGSIIASGVAEAAQSAWAGTGFAWFGPEGHNPETNDGTLSGLTAGEFSAVVYAPWGGSAGLQCGEGAFAVYGEQAACSVPTSAPAFHQGDAVILAGASYPSVYHATTCFYGTGTAFIMPAGSSINKTARLSNSSSVPIAVTGVATAFTLAAGASRDLYWSGGDEVTPRWY